MTRCTYAAATHELYRSLVVGRVRCVEETGRAGGDAVDVARHDALWLGGMFYINPEDPSLIVPKRAGIGTTINLGRPVGRTIGALIILILAGVVVTTAISCA